jgi:hypothetical protein
MASQITKNRTMKITLRRLLLAISLYTGRILSVGIPTNRLRSHVQSSDLTPA